MASPNFLQKMIKFEKDKVQAKTIKRVKKVLNDPNCSEERVRQASKAALRIRMWMEAIVMYATLKAQTAAEREDEEVEVEEE